MLFFVYVKLLLGLRLPSYSKASLVALGAAAQKLGDSLGTLRDSVLGELTREHQLACSLDLAGGEGSLGVVGSELASLTSNALEDVSNEGVHDAHGLLGDTNLRVHLLEHLVDVRLVRFRALRLALLLVAVGLGGLGDLGSL